MKRIISMGFAALVMLSALVVLDMGPVGNVKAFGDPIWNGSYWETAGDWVVDGTTTIFTYTSTTIVVNGNLIIKSPYTLTLQNVTLVMNSPFDGAYNITVENSTNSITDGARLVIEDVGGNPSVITNNGTGDFGFRVEGDPVNLNGNLTMRNSKLLHCGWGLSDSEYRSDGLWIAGDAIVEYCDISEGHVGIVVYGGVDPFINPIIQHNVIHDNPMGAGIYLSELESLGERVTIGPGNEIQECYWGIFTELCANVKIHNNSLHDNGFGGTTYGGGLGIFDFCEDIYVEDNNINANWQNNIYGFNSNNIYIHRNEVNGSTNFTQFQEITGLYIKNNYFCQGGPGPFAAYVVATEIANGVFDNNVVSDNVGFGALFTLCDIDVLNSRFENNGAGGCVLQMSFFAPQIVYNNIFKNNPDMGLHIVGDGINISKNWFEGNGDGTPFMGNPTWQDCGLDIMNSDNIFVYGNWFVHNVRTIGSDPVHGIYLLGTERVTNVYLEKNQMHENNYNLYCRGGVSATDTNSTYNLSGLISPTPYDVFLNESEDAYTSAPENHVTFLNTTFDNSSVHIEANSDHTVQWYKHIKVEDNLGNPIPDASIWTNDSFGINEGASGAKTDSDGKLKFIPLTEYVNSSISRTFHTPHSIDVEDPTRIGYDEANMWHSHYNTIVLNERPTVTDLRTEFGPTGSVLRINTITIIIEGSDLEDSNLDLTPHIEFRVNETSTWVDETSPYFGSWSYDAGNGWWTITFTPPIDAPIDTYGFRARLEDSYPSYSDWYLVDDMVDVLNNPPLTIWVGEGASTVYRGNTVYIYADGDDIEDNGEDDTWDAMCEYCLNGSSSWSDVYITESAWDSIAEHWRFTFEPPATRPNPNQGPVDFRVRFMDSDGTWNNTWYEKDNLVHILNNLPVVEDMQPGYSEVCRGESIWIYVNASDAEDIESDLTVTVQWQYNETSPQGWSGAFITAEPYEGTAPDGWLKVKFTPDANMLLGHYDFRAKVEDTDGDESVDPEWIEISRAVEVQNPEPTLEDVALQADEVLRGEVLEIHLNAMDLGESEPDLTPEIEWLAPFGFWTDTNLMMHYEDINANPNDDIGYWVIEFTPPKTAILGEYQFRVRVRNSAGGVSEGGDWETGSKWDSTYGNAADVLNNEPTASNLRIIGNNTVTRGDYIFIYADGEDFENDEDDLTPYFEYSTDGLSWENDVLTSEMFDSGEDSWRITFNPPEEETFGLGDYDFRVRFEDENGDESNVVEVSDLVEVENAPPSVVSFNIPESYGYRMEDITIIADGKDDDHGESGLDAIFEYKRPTDSDWTGSDDTGTYFGSPTYFNGHWQIDFEPPADAEAGDYSFRVAFSDGIDTTTFMEKIDAYELLNEPPEVEITSPDSGIQSSTTIIFAVDVNDDKDTTFTYLWDFDDGMTSSEEFPTHTFEPGHEYEVTVTVQDSDGSETTAEITIVVLEDSDVDSDGDGYSDINDAFPLDPDEWKDTDGDGIGDNKDTDDDGDGTPDVIDPDPLDPEVTDKEEFDWLTPLLLLIIIILLMVIIFLLLTMRKMRPIEDLPEEPEDREPELEPEKESPSEEPPSTDLKEEPSSEITEEEPPPESPTSSEEPTEEPLSEDTSSPSETSETIESEEPQKESGPPPPPPPSE